jgi:hypothetical protein
LFFILWMTSFMYVVVWFENCTLHNPPPLSPSTLQPYWFVKRDVIFQRGGSFESYLSTRTFIENLFLKPPETGTTCLFVLYISVCILSPLLANYLMTTAQTSYYRVIALLPINFSIPLAVKPTVFYCAVCNRLY